MRVLTTAPEINCELVRLIRECATCKIAVAWAGVGFDAFDLLLRHNEKIGRMVVGTHFYQTHPQFIEAFLGHPGVRFVLNPDGVFHPKVYLFEKTGSNWECLIGSPNLTTGGVATNDELAVLISAEDSGAADAIMKVTETIKTYWLKAHRPDRAWLEEYQKVWTRNQRAKRELERRVSVPLRARSLIEFAKTLNGTKVPTIGSREKRHKTMFTVDVAGKTLVFTPQSSKQPYTIAEHRLIDFCKRYELKNKTKNTSVYLDTGVSSYVLGLIDLYEQSCGTGAG